MRTAWRRLAGWWSGLPATKPADEDGLDRVREVWSEQAGTWNPDRGMHWVEHPAVRRRIDFKVTGAGAGDRYQYFMNKYVPTGRPLDRVLTLGCGGGEFERGLAQYNLARLHEAVDIAEGALQRAKQAADALGLTHIKYALGDLNRLTLPRNAYDVIFGISSVHHVRALEHLFEQVRAGLKPGGYFFVDEFIGPSQFQWTDGQVRLVNEIVAGLPAAYRRSVSKPGQMKAPVVRPTIEQMNAGDPSEAIRSAEIVPLLGRYFEIAEVKGYGGSLLHLLLEDIAGNFRPADPESMRCLERLFAEEDQLIASGQLQHDFGVVIARRPR
jgi:SAM-dependent methyltransferase